MSKALTTIQVAHLLDVSVKSLQTWIDQGKLRAGRTPGGHRRIDAADLVAFLQKQGLPVPSELILSAPRILVVDDDPDVTTLIAREIRLRHPDWEVVEAHDGFRAGQLAESMAPNVVILDIVMPGVDGFEVCQRIREKDTVRRTAVIAITGRRSAAVEARILKCGARACLPKPLEMDRLLLHVKKALEGRG
jgi:excisionase family DNA binding protein